MTLRQIINNHQLPIKVLDVCTNETFELVQRVHKRKKYYFKQWYKGCTLPTGRAIATALVETDDSYSILLL